MKILYGINGVGNGHITRSRILGAELLKQHDVDFLISGRDKFFDMEVFGSYSTRKGLVFVIDNGKLSIPKTIMKNDMSTFLRDIDELDLSGYDLVISDFEPITAWAARIQGVKSYGIGHQYAFLYDIPKERNNFFTDLFMKWYAPVDIPIGLHWDSFGFNIRPPIVEMLTSEPSIPNKVLVYLAFESKEFVISLLSEFSEFTFYVYGFDVEEFHGNVKLFKSSKDGFLYDLKTSSKVICNSGFELISEALYLGKDILTKPVIGQMEQHSNRLALERLNLASTTLELNTEVLNSFLTKESKGISIKWPNVAKQIARELNEKS